jgi:hypothetical protein
MPLDDDSITTRKDLTDLLYKKIEHDKEEQESEKIDNIAEKLVFGLASFFGLSIFGLRDLLVQDLQSGNIIGFILMILALIFLSSIFMHKRIASIFSPIFPSVFNKTKNKKNKKNYNEWYNSINIFNDLVSYSKSFSYNYGVNNLFKKRIENIQQNADKYNEEARNQIKKIRLDNQIKTLLIFVSIGLLVFGLLLIFQILSVQSLVQTNALAAIDDYATTPTNNSISFNVLSNDNLINNIRISDHSEPLNGFIDVNSNGTITYQPFLNFIGKDTFTYTVSDDKNAKSTANVFITVTPTNHSPKAFDKQITTFQSIPATITLNGSDPDYNQLYFISGNPQHGNISSNNSGQVIYRPFSGYTGNDSFSYVVNDGYTNSTNQGNVFINIKPHLIVKGIPFKVTLNDKISDLNNTSNNSNIKYTIHFKDSSPIIDTNSGIFSDSKVLDKSTAEFKTNNLSKNENKTGIIVLDPKDIQNNSLQNIESSISIDGKTVSNTTQIPSPLSIDVSNLGSAHLENSISSAVPTLVTYVTNSLDKILNTTEKGINIASSAYETTTPCLNIKLNKLSYENYSDPLYEIVLKNCSRHPEKLNLTTTDLPKEIKAIFNPQISDINSNETIKSLLKLIIPSNISGHHVFGVKGDVLLNLFNFNYVVATATTYGDFNIIDNKPPVIKTENPAQIKENDFVLLNASKSFDPDGNILSYSWKQVSGPPVNISDANTANAKFIAPSISYDTHLSFILEINDNKNSSSTNIVDIKETHENHPPISKNNTLFVKENTPINITLFAIDNDPFDHVKYILKDNSTNGLLTGLLPNLKYTPKPNYTGNDSFSYIANDDHANSSKGIINLKIMPINNSSTTKDILNKTSEMVSKNITMNSESNPDIGKANIHGINNQTNSSNSTKYTNGNNHVLKMLIGCNKTESFYIIKNNFINSSNSNIVLVHYVTNNSSKIYCILSKK